MSMSQHESDMLFDILSRGWDAGSLSPDDLEQLEQLVRKHGVSACEELIQFSSMHVELGAIMDSSRAHRRAMAAIAAESADVPRETGPDFTPRDSTWRTIANNRWVRRAIVAGAAAVAGIAFWLTKGEHEKGDKDLAHVDSHWATKGEHEKGDKDPARVDSEELQRPPQMIACVTYAENAIWAGDKHLVVGTPIKQGERLQLTSGSVKVSMACGVDIVMSGECAIKLAADNLVQLEHGKVTAEAAKWATGFVIETHALRITDLGTRFAISADPDGVSEAYVLDGQVLAEPMKVQRPKRSSMLLKSGEAIRVSVPQATVNRFASQQANSAERFGGFRPFRPIPLWNTGVGQKVGDRDAHWQITAGDPKFGPYPRAAIVTSCHPYYLDNMPYASQWISVDHDPFPGAPPKSVHTFEVKFDLTGYDPETVRIVGLFLVDDAINQLRINGRSVPFERWQTTWEKWDFKTFHSIEINSGFVPGVNTIALDIYNSPTHPDSPPDTPNPMGMRAEWQAFGCESK